MSTKSNNEKYLTNEVKAFFKELIEDAGNWSGCPMFGGNVGGDQASKGYLVNLKKAGIVTTEKDEENKKIQWVNFTLKAYELGLEVGAKMDAAIFWDKEAGRGYNYDELPLVKAKPKAKKIKGKTAAEFIDFLEHTLIPDLKESGREFTAEDFETAVKWIKHFQEVSR